jgi:hypothetical protein
VRALKRGAVIFFIGNKIWRRDAEGGLVSSSLGSTNR